MDDLRLETLPGVGPVTRKKLNDSGIHNIMDLVVRGPVEISDITGMDFDSVVNRFLKFSLFLMILVELQPIPIVWIIYLMVELKLKL